MYLLVEILAGIIGVIAFIAFLREDPEKLSKDAWVSIIRIIRAGTFFGVSIAGVSIAFGVEIKNALVFGAVFGAFVGPVYILAGLGSRTIYNWLMSRRGKSK